MPLDGQLAGLTAAGLLELAAQRILPPERLTVAEYAARHRHLSNEGGGISGPWRHEVAPYLVEPMNCLTSWRYTTTAVVGPGQSGKTECGHNWLLHSVASDPADFLWYMQTDAGLEAHVKSRINPMIDAHDALRFNQGLRAVDDSLHFKRFRGMSVEFLSATLTNLINKRAPRIVADEVDAYPPSLGDVKALLDVRRQTFGDASMILALSHPDKARGLDPDRDWSDGIMAIYADSDRRVWYWPCPQCGGWSSPVPIAARVMTLHYPEQGSLDEIEAGARLICPVNGCIIEDHHRRAMNLAGRWIGDGQHIAEDGTVTGELVKRKTAGFWIVGVMSPFIMGGIGGLARALVKAQREFEAGGDDAENTLRQVTVKQLGVPYVPPKSVGTLDANVIAERAEIELKFGTVPEGVRFLTAWLDVQLGHFEVLVRGWGVDRESWIVDFFRVTGDGTAAFAPATDAEAWDRLIDAVIQRAYPLADGSGRAMRIRGIGFDSAGAPGVTLQAGSAWNRWKARKLIRLYGKSEGRDVYSVIPTKGANGLNAPRLSVTYPDTSRKSQTTWSGTVPLLLFNPNLFKDDLAGQLQTIPPAPWSIHFPGALLSKKRPHVWFEQLVAEQRDKSGRWSKPHNAVRNEAMDLMVGTDAVARLHGLTRINWERPPSWAAPWDKNSMIVEVPVAGEALPEGTAGSTVEPSPAAPSGPVVTVKEQPARKPIGKRLA